MSLNYNPAPVLYRRARAATARARETADGQRAWTANPRAREADDCIIAIVLAYAAVETAWYWEQIQAGVLPHAWPTEFREGLAEVARARGRCDPSPLESELSDKALDLGAWRNFLLHADERARKRLEARLGQIDPSALNAHLAEKAVATARELGDYMFAAAGTQRLFDTNWVDPSE